MTGSLRAALLTILLFGLWACTPSLDEAQAAWQRIRPAGYSFEYQRTCYCPQSGVWWRVTVRHDSVVDVEQLDSLGSAPYAPKVSHPNLTQLFDGIRAFKLRPHTWAKVSYDKKWHFPNEASGDATDRIGNGWRFRVRDFQSLP